MIKIGLLHSQTGEMAISETALIDAALMAIDEINQLGGVLGETITPILEDCESKPSSFAQKAQKLAEQGVVSLFGCWKSSCRKAVRPIVEQHNLLLWYPLQYEGLEQSPNIFYTGSCLNQQVQPAIQWLLDQHHTRFYLLGSNYIFPWTANKLVKAQIEARGGTVVGEDYVPMGHQSFEQILHQIQSTQPDVIFNTLNGAGNLTFYRQFYDAGLDAAKLPVMGASVSEVELQSIGAVAAGHYGCWSYFQSLDLPSNHQFVQNFKNRFGKARVTSDPIVAAYSQLYLWKQSVEAAQSFETDRVRQFACGQTFEAPGGPIQIDPNHHVWKPCRIGQIQADGQFKEVFETQMIRPLPWIGTETVQLDHTPLVISLLSEVSDWIEKKQQLMQTLSQVQEEVKQRQQAEKQMALWQQAVNASNNPIVISDAQQPNMPLIYVNPAFEQQTGYTAAEIIGQNCRFLQNGKTDQPALNVLKEAICNQQSCTVVLRNYRKDGTLFWNELATSPVFDAEGCLTHYVGVQKDITERILASELLEQKIQERTAELTNALQNLQKTQNQLVEQEQVVKQKTYYDPLTGLPNRNYFINELQRVIDNTKHKSCDYAVLFLDIDQFRVVNDSLGHQAGDLLLKLATDRIQKILRPTDILARLGGDEFVLLLENLQDFTTAEVIADRIQQAISLPFTLCGQDIFATLSIGIALSRPNYSSPQEVLRDADIAMHHAKNSGKRRYRVFDIHMHIGAIERLQLEGDLRQALQRGELYLQYQPIIKLNEQQLSGFEALIRWQHPTLGRIPPDKFIPIAEESGLIHEIGKWVIIEACTQLKFWQHQLPELPPITMNVNLSAVQLWQSKLAHEIENILTITEVPGSQLKLELTESTIVSGSDETEYILQHLKDLGIQLCIDDFGVGYSSLSRLHEFPIDTLKIDRSFIKRLSLGQKGLEMVDIIMMLAHRSDMDVVAEGIETLEQLQQLQALGIEYGQGYLFSKPLDAADVKTYLHSKKLGLQASY